MKKSFLFVLLIQLIGFLPLIAQPKKPAAQPAAKKIIIEHSDFADRNEIEMPGVALLTGNVRVSHDGAIMTCNKAYVYEDENYLKAFGDVHIVQGDTLFLDSRYAEYNGMNKQAFATGNVNMRSPDMRLVTDTIYFDRNIQEAYYRSPGTIYNKDNVLKSNTGRFYVNQKKFQFLTKVVVTNPKYVLESNHLDYYNNSGHAYLFGPSTITSKDNFIYTEKGFYDSKRNIGHFLRKSYIKYKDRLIEGDSLYYDRTREFASATRNVKITDTINKGLVKGQYGEVYKAKDSSFVTGHAVAINLVEKDSVYIHGKRLVLTGPAENRIIRAYPNARIFKVDLSGKCDSIHSSQLTGITKMIGRPVLWNFDNQLTGDIMHLLGDSKTEKLDSLKVLGNAFVVSKDTVGTGYNQVKGANLYGKFKDNKLSEVDLIKNTEAIYYMRDDETHDLIGINKSAGSRINLIIEENKIRTMTVFDKPAGDILPEKDFPENARKLRGFIWRGEERIKTKDDIFPPEEEEIERQAQEESKKDAAKPDVPMEPRKETLNYDEIQKHPEKSEPKNKKGKKK
ncbi:OstA-like protein [Flavobacterium silvaticum]|uniref:OstA-like protein n=1 Tax=Flavobacterium silvaticum TaxID=1852020 RepID=A0A972FVA7_9FLAO|nr:OstA-like protein [Flavobacterium silvaticum]NMH29198.1 OstA-like protein [Flavobacterium silvaticum]